MPAPVAAESDRQARQDAMREVVDDLRPRGVERDDYVPGLHRVPGEHGYEGGTRRPGMYAGPDPVLVTARAMSDRNDGLPEELFAVTSTAPAKQEDPQVTGSPTTDSEPIYQVVSSAGVTKWLTDLLVGDLPGAVGRHRQFIEGKRGPEMFVALTPGEYRHLGPYDWSWFVEGDARPQGPMIVPFVDHLGPDRPIEISMPGLYQLTAAEYLADPVPGGSLSNSDIKKLMPPSAPAKYRYNRDRGIRVYSDAFSYGHAAHRKALGAGQDIVVRPAQWSDYRKQEARDWKRDVLASGRTPITPADLVEVEAMAAALLEDRWAAGLLGQPGRPEQALFFLDEATGVMRRTLIDWLPDLPEPGRKLILVDYKTTEHGCPDDRMERHIYEFGYHRQGCTQMDAVEALGLAPDGAEFILLFQEKEAPYLVTPVRLSAKLQQIGRIENRNAIELFAQCQGSAYWPGYVAEGDDLPVASAPRWIENRYEGQLN